ILPPISHQRLGAAPERTAPSTRKAPTRPNQTARVAEDDHLQNKPVEPCPAPATKYGNREETSPGPPLLRAGHPDVPSRPERAGDKFRRPVHLLRRVAHLAQDNFC